MSRSKCLRLPLFACAVASLVLLSAAQGVRAQMWGYTEPGGNPKTYLNAGSLYQPSTHVQGGGSVSVSRYSLSVGSQTAVGDKTSLGAGLSYQFEDYNFARLPGFAVADPWNKVNRLGLSTRIGYRASSEWSLFAAPSVQYAGEQGADVSDSLMYGGVAGALYRPSKAFMIGFGAGVFYRLEETRLFPALVFRWKITDRLRLGNSFRTGPAGPAGLELAYTIDRNWETAIAGGYRSYRFRLDEHGATPGGIGEVDSVPFFARLSRRVGPHLRADLYGGAAFAGKLRLEDKHGHEIDQVSYDTAPLAGLAITMIY